MIRRIKNRWVKGAGEFQAATMSDIAFLLLIFFITTTIFSVEQGIPLVLPARQASVTLVKQRNILEIKAYPDGSVIAEGDDVGIGGVRALVERRLAANQELIVVVVTHPNAEYGLMVDLLDELKLARCRRISLKTMDG
jgi:biopolymer transport protein ExbD